MSLDKTFKNILVNLKKRGEDFLYYTNRTPLIYKKMQIKKDCNLQSLLSCGLFLAAKLTVCAVLWI